MDEQQTNKVIVTNPSIQNFRTTLTGGDILIDEDGDLYIFAVNERGYVLTSLNDGIHYENIFADERLAYHFAIDEGFKIYRNNEIKVHLGERVL